ncbi:FtsX-like permease family protein [Actinoplanes sp. TBRC 11911]|uniref:FtsX-like permease family protein n=1 Tax=Actinoplanes sp. TBRC 11911 TaxID=2729386 RepID=UPI00145F4A24|nr:FtsX-like permease family protein [Actinoplanes sp. TBRC 11911]NMO53737.1 FtsX-like permease family protein [Actinoplanes sp. TBRC 11911]
MMPARIAVLRWAWRLFRREWRRQALVLALLAVAVAATVFGLGAAGSALPSGAAQFGDADYLMVLRGAGMQGDVATVRQAFPASEVINHQNIAVPGSANPVDLRDQAPGAALGAPMLRLTAGRYPAGSAEIAVTDRTATLFHLAVGNAWQQGGRRWSVVGIVENPNNLLDTFALAAPGQIGSPDHVTVLVRATAAQFRAAQRPATAEVQFRGDAGPDPAFIVLILATIGLLFVGLLAAAGFAVLAQRRLRALGMLAAIGARHRHLRLVMLANGAVVGTVAAIVGGITGLAAWLLLTPRLETVVQHRINRFDLPWLQILLAAALAVVAAVVAAWWPARAAARVPVVAALSARPPQPRPVHRFAVLGALLLAAGLILLAQSNPERPALVVGGVAGTAAGMLLLAPLLVAVLATVARAFPVAARIALRDLGRYRARSGAALAAISMATGIAAAIIVGAGAAQAAAPSGGNLPDDELIVWVAPSRIEGPVPQLDASQLAQARSAVSAIAGTIHGGTPLPLIAGISPGARLESLNDSGLSGKPVVAFAIPHRSGGSTEYHGDEMIPLLLATPDILGRYGITAGSIDPAADVLTSHTDLSRYRLIGADRQGESWQPRTQHIGQLPANTSEPTTLLTEHGMRALGLTPAPVGWLIATTKPLTPAQVDKAQQAARASGLDLAVETRPLAADLSRLRTGAAAIGAAVALGVLAVTVGLIRAEAGRDLRTLAANGAARGTRRRLTAATTLALALLGAVLGTAGAYAALIAWYHQDLHSLARVPVEHLSGLIIGLPLVAAAAAWLLAGREPTGVARSPLE